jgi:hypothetical protein
VVLRRRSQQGTLITESDGFDDRMVKIHTVPALVGSNETEILVLRLCTLPDTSTDTSFDFVWRTNALVALFKLDSHWCT